MSVPWLVVMVNGWFKMGSKWVQMTANAFDCY